MTEEGGAGCETAIWEQVRKEWDEQRRKFATSQAESDQRIQSLVEENEQLKGRLQPLLRIEHDYEELREEHQRLEARLLNVHKNTDVPWEQHQHILEKINEIEKKYLLSKRQLSSYQNSAQIWQERYEQCRDKLERSKAECRKWQAYAQGCEAKSATKSAAKNLLSPDTTSTPVSSSYFRAGSKPQTHLPQPSSLTDSIAKASITKPHFEQALRIDEPAIASDAFRMSRHSPKSRSSPDERELQETPRPPKTVSNAEVPSILEPGVEKASSRDRAAPMSITIPSDSVLIDEQPLTSATILAQAAGSSRDNTQRERSSEIPAPSIERHAPPSLVSTQSTEGETIRERSTPAVQTHYRLEDEDDEPVVVSVRNLKRKRQTPQISLHEDQHAHQSPAHDHDIRTPIMVKEEAGVDGLTRDSVARLQHDHSIEDLDTIPGIVLTPRKLQRLRSRSYGTRNKTGRKPPALQPFRSSSLPPDAGELDHRLSVSFREQLERCSAPADRRHAVKAEPDAEIFADDNSDSDMLDPSSKRIKARVLTPISVNSRSIVSTPATGDGLLKGRRRKQYPSRIDDLAEDGDRHFAKRNVGAVAAAETSSGKASRLNNMLETPSARKSSLVTSSKPTRTRSPPTSRSPSKKSSRKPALEVRDTFDDDDEYVTRPEDEPLRARPLARLTMNDFKINPAYNQGLDYAFSEVVRNRDARRCMAGCTRPECCGTHFRKVIEIGGPLAAPAAGLWSSQDDIDADERVLQQYLGPDARVRLRNMSSEERSELLLRAQTERMAQKHGRHKMDWAREATPPGFWETGMPSTQEQEENRRKAAQRDRDKLEERYLEAMRGNGRWKFRDE